MHPPLRRRSAGKHGQSAIDLRRLRQKGIQVTDADISTEIDKVAGRFGLARDRWLQLLREERGFSEEQYRREVLWPMLALRQLVSARSKSPMPT